MRKVKFINEGYYYIYNRGVDKRTIFQNIDDLMRFYQSMQEFNVIEPIGSIYENFLFKARIEKEKKFGGSASKLLKSSWEEYINNGKGICDKKIILDQFESILDYKKFAEESLKGIKERKEIKKFILE